MARISFTFDDRRMRQKVQSMDSRVNQAIGAVVDYHGLLGEGAMRSNAVWTDRTGAARSSLSTDVEHSGSKHTITFAHGVHYGIWLEIANSGRYQVIMPTIREVGPMLMNNLRGLLSRI